MPDQDIKLAKLIHHGFTRHSKLNPELFDDENMLRPEVRKQLMVIANDFIDSLGVDQIDFEDVILTGSIVNYNWNPYSDVDLHIVYDFSEIDGDDDLVSEFFESKKSVWNQIHDVEIYGYDVEIYGQDINEEHVSTGVYSVLNNEWIIKPEPQNYDVNPQRLVKKTKHFIRLFNDVIESDNTDEEKLSQIKKIKDKIKKYRQSGLEEGGEYSEENLVFKLLRRVGYLEKLSDTKHELDDKIMSLEKKVTNV